jgi:hypothetical protein
MMSPQSWEKLTINGSFAKLMHNIIAWRQKKKSVGGDPDQEI